MPVIARPSARTMPAVTSGHTILRKEGNTGDTVCCTILVTNKMLLNAVDQETMNAL